MKKTIITLLAPHFLYAQDISGEEISLSKFTAEPQALWLRSVSDQRKISFALSPFIVLDYASIELSYSNSISLLKERSSTAILLNGIVQDQFSLDPLKPQGLRKISLPLKSLKTGFNDISLESLQHYTYRCENEGAPELWTQFDLEKSKLVVSYHREQRDYHLSDLSDLFKFSIGSPEKLHILSNNQSTDLIKWGSYIAQAAAVRFNYTPLPVTHGTLKTDLSFDPKTAYVIVGTEKEIDEYLPPLLKKQITGPFLGIYSLENLPVLVVSGKTTEEVDKAAWALTLADFPLVDAPFMTLTEVDVNQNISSTKPHLSYEKTYLLSDFDLQDTTFRGQKAQSTTVSFYMPPDIYAYENSNGVLGLHFAHGGGIRSDSVFSVFLNESFVASVQLDKEGGSLFENYKMNVPMSLLKPGENKLRFEAILVPLETGDCRLIQDQNLIFTLYKDSTLRFEEAGSYADLPDLKLTAETAFPYFKPFEGGSIALHLPEQDSFSMGAAWTLVGRLSQAASVPLKIQATTGDKLPSDHVIIVGKLPSIPKTFLEKAPLNLLGETTQKTHLAQESHKGIIEKKLIHEGKVTPLEDSPDEFITRKHSQGKNAYLMAFNNQKETMAAVLTAASSEILLEATHRLIIPEFWYQVRGDVFSWGTLPQSGKARMLGNTFAVGHLGIKSLVDHYASAYPYIWISSIILTLIGFVLLTAGILRKIQKKRRND